MNTFLYYPSIVLSLLFLFFMGYWWGKSKRLTSSISESTPNIVINVPADFKPLDVLPLTQIEGAKAMLWWTVFNAASREYSHSDSAIKCANAAVDKVFNPS